jgi:cysteine synthase A
VKAEAFNPASSVKDRLAIGIIEAAERSGALKPGQTVVEATSGNTGIGLAMVCAAKGYPLVITMAESFSVERRKLMRFLGAKVVLTPKEEKGFGMYRKAGAGREANGWFLASQFETAANAEIHENTTAREILADFDGKRLDYWVTGYGTGGTVTGVGRVLREERPGHEDHPQRARQRRAVGSAARRRSAARPTASRPESHPAFEPHPIQGWTPDFIPLVLQEAIDKGYYDELIPGAGADGIAWSRKLAPRKASSPAMSGGSTFAIAMASPRRRPRFGDPVHAARHRRALSLDAAVRGIEDVMSDEEYELSASTPGAQMKKG